MVRTLLFQSINMSSILIASNKKNYFLLLLFMDFLLLKSFLPEIFLSLCILIQLVFNVYLITFINYNFPVLNKEIFSQTGFILLCVLFLLYNSKIEVFFLNFLFVNDSGSNYVKFLLILSCLFILSTIVTCFKFQKLNFFEFFTILLLSILSLLLLISSCDMLSAYLAIEMQALSFYILACFKRNSSFSIEAGLKYFITGAFISGIFLFGCSIIYGILGTLNFNSISLLLFIPIENDFVFLNHFLLVGILLVIITFLFKLSVVPFHFWSPDVYEGSPLASTIIFSIIPKLALFHFLIKWLIVVLDSFPQIETLLFFCGIFSILVGSFFAIRQKRIKRLVIYSSIAQVGFLISALSINSLNSFVAVYFFIIIYILSSILMWSHISFFYSFQDKILIYKNKTLLPIFLSNLSNFFKSNKLWAFSLVLIFFSIAGIPPLSGFLSKIFIILSIIEHKEIFNILLLVLISSISVFYYLRIMKVAFFEPTIINKNKKDSISVIFKTQNFDFDCLIISILLYLLLFIFFNPSFLLLICHKIVLSSFFF